MPLNEGGAGGASARNSSVRVEGEALDVQGRPLPASNPRPKQARVATRSRLNFFIHGK